jgi:hypothetical protein
MVFFFLIHCLGNMLPFFLIKSDFKL